jgi:hypothetical protein
MTTLRMAKWTSFLAVMGFFVAACSGGAVLKGDGREQTQERAAIESIEVGGNDESVSITVGTTKSVAYTLYQKEDPLRLVLELPGTSAGAGTTPIQVNRGSVSVIDSVSSENGSSHVEFYLNAPSRYDIDSRGREVLLTIAPEADVESPAEIGEPVAAVEEAVSFVEEAVD